MEDFPEEVVPFSMQMVEFNCSFSGFLHHNSAWCQHAEEKNCRTWNVSTKDLPDLCLSRNEYLEKYLGPRRSPLFIPVCATYLFIFMAGVLGNVLTCTVIAHYRIMQTPTNYYLFSLAVSDLLVLLLGMPLELYEMWNNYPFLLGLAGCYFKTFLFETVCFASVLNVTALSAERYLMLHCVLVLVFAICWAPFHVDRVMWSYIDNWTEERRMVYEWVHVLSGVFFYLSSAMNPILYNLMSTRFREMFKEVMCKTIHHQYSITSRSTVCENGVSPDQSV